MVLPIRLYGDPILRARARAVTNFSEIPELAKNMIETMMDAHGVGLAAPQIGQSIRMFVMAEFEDEIEEGQEPEDSNQRINISQQWVVVNPRIEILDAEPELGREGCLSIPELYSDGVPRAFALRLHYQDEHGQNHRQEFEDYMARVVQHEHDHLEGKLFIDLLPQEFVQNHREALAGFQKQAKANLKELAASEKTKKKKPARR